MQCDDLSTLPVDHPLRNTPLRSINAEYRSNTSKVWHSVNVLGGIKADITFNDLANCWTTWDTWRGSLNA
jgi:hypothetical protein